MNKKIKEFLLSKTNLPLTMWGMSGVLFFITLGHLPLYFTFIIFIWLFAGLVVALLYRKWDERIILISPLILTLGCFTLGFLYNFYATWRAKLALNDLVTSNLVSTSPWNIEVWGDKSSFANDVSKEYKFEYEDNFFNSYEFIVRFENGTAYYLMISQKNFIFWSISISKSSS